MPKSRVSSVDLRHLVVELRESCVGLRLANLYDVTPKVYMLKFARPEHKEFVIVESGVRIHTTGFARAKPTLPSTFTLKLRKHLRTWRLESVAQLGVDRVVDFTFGREETCFHLIFEFYAKGNIILTDHQYTILALLRTHRQDEESLYAVREHYPVERAVQHLPMTETRLLDLLRSGAPATPVKQLLNAKTEYGPAQIDHCLIEADMKPSAKLVDGFAAANAVAVQRLLEALQRMDEILTGPTTRRGVVYKRKVAIREGGAVAIPAAPADDATLYEHFSAFPLRQYENDGFEGVPFPSFNEAVDHYFSKFEDQRAGQEVEVKQQEKLSKVDKVRKDHEERIRELQRVQEVSEHKANLIILNAEEVEAAIMVIRSALAQSIDWTELKRVVKEQRRAGNPIAMMIHDFHFEQNKITLLLTENTDDATEADLTAPVQQVAVDISLSAYANARSYFDAKKKSVAKEDKTKAATQKAVKSAQKKADQELKKEVPSGPAIKVMRKPYWFEKFNWFITTENFLVVSGRDAQQNEILVKRYLRPGDLYIHADLHGASSCILKNPSGKVVPPVSLSQAGTMCVCRSSAWDNKIVTSAWWVYHNQVSKTAPTGEYLPTGSFMIRGKKNFLPPNALVMGVALMWRVAEECIPNHLQERRPPEQFSLNTYHLQTMEDPLSRCFSVEDGRSVSLTAGDAASEASPARDDSGRPGSPLQLDSDEAPEGRQDSLGPDGEECAGRAKQEGHATNETNVNTDFDRYGLPQAPFDPSLGDSNQLAQRAAQSWTSPSAPEMGMEGAGESKDGGVEKNGRKRMSAKERRVMKQQQRRSEDSPTDESDPVPTPPPCEKPAAPQPCESNKGPAANPPMTKAQRSKMKKIMQKYGEQDEEDRMLAMMLLGHRVRPKEAPAPEAVPKDPKVRPAKESAGLGCDSPAGAANAEAASPVGHVEPPVSVENHHRENGHRPAHEEKLEVMEDAVEDVAEEVAEEGAQEGAEEAGPSPCEEEEEALHAQAQEDVRQLLQEEGLRALNEEEKEQMNLNELDALTGCPQEADTLLFAVPMCAPYSALQAYRYKVKVTPGALKKGKAAQAIEKYFMCTKDAPEQEKHLMKQIDHMDMVAAVLGNCRVSIPGSSEKSATTKPRKGK
eukprot:GGOE01014608.1.p1 GENE.GGOE01014608.1~~GGOE01014608.1.p1  ORF type:complete len:1133 (+),score=385.10 GGOE01014608.1:88-3486(+)